MRISENPENFKTVFESAGKIVEDLRAGKIEPTEATAMARGDTIRQRMLETDIKGRVIDHKLRMKTIDNESKAQIASQ